MAIFYSSGHNLKGENGEDPGAMALGRKENELTQDFESYVMIAFQAYPNTIFTDTHTESLVNYLHRITPGSASVVCESHFNAANGKASGVEVLVPNDPTQDERNLAGEISSNFSTIMGIPNRGVKTESESHRGRLGLMRKEGINALIEICFMDNENDINKYLANRTQLANVLTELLVKYDNLH
jgi:N-acetylmuramoyl-L-alanine amidase